ncbi:hypothetical protein PsAD2_02215 [Pseudovibrio axinellae]|uniref:SPW repeat protein n=1 Tax=Pseudovibrio axinellae TaxID=989403 RepID=A0A165YBY3_9HYPH|nr:hypothetical protein [Pseudovibrio axinellae]KZL18700.1 hypothetical protein PsAD2_02215 [Pseudovibrio axinellae]SEP96326.1 hypothetical protein SAMN05421798_101826 [Pseudovibrio axinellae]
MVMPNSIKLFEKITIWSLVISVISGLISPLQPSPIETTPSLMFGAVLFTFGLGIGLILLVSRGRSVIAKWIWIILQVLAVILQIYDFPTNDYSNPSVFIGLIVAAVGIFCIFLLFTDESKEWFLSKEHERMQRLLR